MKLSTNKEITEAAKNKYGYGTTYWHGVKMDAFREGAKWMREQVKKFSSNLPVIGSSDSFKAVKLVPEGWTVLTPMIKTLIGKVDYRHHVQNGLSEEMAKFMAQELNRYLR